MDSPVFGTLQQHDHGWTASVHLFGRDEPTLVDIEAHFDEIDFAIAEQLLHEAESTCRLIQPETEREFRRIVARQIVDDSWEQLDGETTDEEVVAFERTLTLDSVVFGDESCCFIWRRSHDGASIVLQTDSKLRVQEVTTNPAE